MRERERRREKVDVRCLRMELCFSIDCDVTFTAVTNENNSQSIGVAQIEFSGETSPKNHSQIRNLWQCLVNGKFVIRAIIDSNIFELFHHSSFWDANYNKSIEMRTCFNQPIVLPFISPRFQRVRQQPLLLSFLVLLFSLFICTYGLM